MTLISLATSFMQDLFTPPISQQYIRKQKYIIKSSEIQYLSTTQKQRVRLSVLINSVEMKMLTM